MSCFSFPKITWTNYTEENSNTVCSTWIPQYTFIFAIHAAIMKMIVYCLTVWTVHPTCWSDATVLLTFTRTETCSPSPALLFLGKEKKKWKSGFAQRKTHKPLIFWTLDGSLVAIFIKKTQTKLLQHDHVHFKSQRGHGQTRSETTLSFFSTFNSAFTLITVKTRGVQCGSMSPNDSVKFRFCGVENKPH